MPIFSQTDIIALQLYPVTGPDFIIEFLK